MDDKIKCEDCGSTDASVERTICPYSKEIHNEEVEAVLCSDCYDRRSDDI